MISEERIKNNIDKILEQDNEEFKDFDTELDVRICITAKVKEHQYDAIKHYQLAQDYAEKNASKSLYYGEMGIAYGILAKQYHKMDKVE